MAPTTCKGDSVFSASRNRVPGVLIGPSSVVTAHSQGACHRSGGLNPLVCRQAYAALFHSWNESVSMLKHRGGRMSPDTMSPDVMNPDAPIVPRKPRVIAVGLHRLRSFFNELAPSYAD